MIAFLVNDKINWRLAHSRAKEVIALMQAILRGNRQ